MTRIQRIKTDFTHFVSLVNFTLRPLRVFSLRALPTGPCGREIPLSNLSKGLCERLFSLRS